MDAKIGIARDDRFLEHKTGHFHPEHPRRLDAVYRMIDRDLRGEIAEFPAEAVPLEILEKVHTPEHIRRILKTSEQIKTHLAPDTPVSAKSYMAAWLAAGSCLRAVDLLAERECVGFFALVRPPGHHAFANRAGGFCIFNNAAVAARYALMRHGFSRIMIVDWDIHHGNGLQDIFYTDPRILYFSTHDLMLYPYSGEPGQAGEDWGEGTTINAPVSRSMGDEDVVWLYRAVLKPVIKNFRPELIMVAAGFDAHRDDPLGRSRWTESAYAGITRVILEEKRKINDPPVFLTLEGGYDPMALASCIRSVILELTKKESAETYPETGHEETRELAEQIKTIHSKYGFVE